MLAVESSKGTLDVALMPWGRFMLLLLEFGVAYIGLAELAPVLGRGLPVFGHLSNVMSSLGLRVGGSLSGSSVLLGARTTSELSGLLESRQT